MSGERIVCSRARGGSLSARRNTGKVSGYLEVLVRDLGSYVVSFSGGAGGPLSIVYHTPLGYGQGKMCLILKKEKAAPRCPHQADPRSSSDQPA
jgi:hypothetical protein